MLPFDSDKMKSNVHLMPEYQNLEVIGSENFENLPVSVYGLSREEILNMTGAKKKIQKKSSTISVLRIKLLDCILNCEFFRDPDSLKNTNEKLFEVEIYKFSHSKGKSLFNGVQIVLLGSHERKFNEKIEDAEVESSTQDLVEIFK